ncbi:MAG TPA: glycine cleavage T C-terminal barrel domain-containing protein [Solirubrobacteraceae bacterium]|nr:glycine cleavage T C-terminal barrel domain-containing protein [Solirubrobacteraceae bacterium]
MAAADVSLSEYRAVREACGLIDRSERGKLALTGADAKPFLQGQVTNDIEALEPGSGCYAAFLTPKGKMLGDLRVLDAGAPGSDPERLGLGDDGDGPGQLLLLDTERVALQGLFNVLRRFSVGYDVQIHKQTLQRGLLSLLGPAAAQVAGVEALAPTEDSHLGAQIDGIPVRAIRTALGVDLLCQVGDTDALADALERRGAVPISEATAECVRIELGRPRYGIDLDDTVIPQEADLNERAVSFTKGCYVGQETVARLYYRGRPNRRLRGLRLAEPAWTGAEITFGDRTVGRLGSVARSPQLGAIALAIVRREAPPGSHVKVGADGIQAVVVELPFAA